MKILSDILSGQPAYRVKQIHRAWFDSEINGYGEVTTLSKDLREKLKDLPWLSVKLDKMLVSKLDDTKKALLRLNDGELIETVLMGRESKKEKSDEKGYTVCVSSQVGCSMGCKFCATGIFGFKRNLSSEEIVDQVRFWRNYLHGRSGADGDPEARGQISNVVLMGQGEPFLNYENVKEALKIILENTEIGPSKITVSTVGIPAMMDKMLEDKDFPAVRFAISLHSAIDAERSKIIPSNPPGFISFLLNWSEKYHERFTSRALFLGIEYTMLDGINDKDKDLKALIKLASNMGRVRINLIPYNLSCVIPAKSLPSTRSGAGIHDRQATESPDVCRDDDNFVGSPMEKIEAWHDKLLKTGFVCTIRRSQGQDIAAACGQLRNTSE